MRNLFFWTHLVLGLTIGLVIASMCASGTVLAFEPQIVHWSERALETVTPPPDGSRRLVDDALIAKARSAKPGSTLTLLMIKEDPTASVLAGFGGNGILFLNPYTGDVLGQGSRAREALHSVEEWHRWLGNRKFGKPITRIAAISFFLLSLSGIYLWWPRKIFRTGGVGHGRNWNLHNTFGIASAFFILVITSTGITMSYGLLAKKSPDGRTRPPQAVRIIHTPAPKPKTFGGWIKPMHTGQVWGVTGQSINFVVALSGLLQIWTGFALAWRRFRIRKKP